MSSLADLPAPMIWFALGLFACIALAYGAALIKGFESGRMRAIASIKVSGDRVAEPRRFWACTAWNVLILVVMLVSIVIYAPLMWR